MRIREGGGNEAELLKMYLPPEVFAGLPININRQIGNGRDDTNDGLIDEPKEALLKEPLLDKDALQGIEAPFNEMC